MKIGTKCANIDKCGYPDKKAGEGTLKRLKRNIIRYKYVYLGLVIADYILFIILGEVRSVLTIGFFIDTIIESAFLYVLIVAIISFWRREA